jgi:double-stranded RNA-binding protein Staufen
MLQVSIGQHSCTGTGPNKKLAKRAAAEGLLQLLGYSRPAAQPAKPSIKTGDSIQDMDNSRKVWFFYCRRMEFDSVFTESLRS